MTDAQIAHAQPNLSEPQALLALLSESLEMARDLAATQRDLQSTNGDALNKLIQSAGLPEEIEAAGQTMQTSITTILTRVSEQDLAQGRDKGLLTPEDYTEALKAKRTLSLSKNRLTEREGEREA